MLTKNGFLLHINMWKGYCNYDICKYKLLFDYDGLLEFNIWIRNRLFST